MRTDQSAELSIVTRLFYGMGSFAYGIKDLAFRSFLLIYYNQIVGLPATLVSFAIFIALLVDAISDPLVGYLSDNLRSRFGRRHPFMYASAIPSAVAFYFLWMPPAGLSNGQLFYYLIIMSCLVRTFITFYEIPSSALAPELATDYDDRTRIASYRYLFGYAGYFGMSFITLFVLLRPSEAYPIGQLNPDGYQTFGWVGAGLILSTILISSFGTHHRIPYLAKPQGRKKSSLRTTMKALTNRGLLAILAFGLLKYTAIGLAGALTLYFGTFLWGLNSAQLAFLTIVGLISGFFAFLLAPKMSTSFGKRNSAAILAIIAVIVALAPIALRALGLFWPNGHALLVPSLFAFEMVYFTCGAASATLVHAMIGDVVDENAVKTGERAEGLVYAANSLMQKSVSGLGVFLAGLLLSWSGMPEGARPDNLNPEIINQLVALYIPIVGGLYIIGACFLYFYEIDRQTQQANLEHLNTTKNSSVP